MVLAKCLFSNRQAAFEARSRFRIAALAEVQSGESA